MNGEDNWRAGNSYAQWVRAAIGRARHGMQPVTTLFDSSVPEPAAILRETIAEGFADPVTTRYTSAFTRGNPYVLAALAKRYAVPEDQILCTTGATGALSLLFRTLVRRGERVLVEKPGFDLFHEVGAAQGLNVDYFHRRGADFALDLDELVSKLRPDTRLIVLSNLHNPSGMLVSNEGLKALARIAESHGTLVLVDEVYGDYADASVRPAAAASLSPNFISISSLTKIFGLNTLRCGWIVAAPEVISLVRLYSEQFEFGLSNLAHAVAALVLEDGARYLAYSMDILTRTRPVMEEQLAKWQADELLEGDLPPFGCISFPKVVGVADTHAFSDWLAERYGVIVAPGEYFGAPGHIRVGHGQQISNLTYGLSALDAGLRAYRDRQSTARRGGARSQVS